MIVKRRIDKYYVNIHNGLASTKTNELNYM